MRQADIVLGRSRRPAEERTSPPDVICAMRAHQTHVHSWRGQTGGLNEERAALHSLHSNCSSTRSLGKALKLVAKEDTMKPTVIGRRSSECLGKDFNLFGEFSVCARFAHRKLRQRDLNCRHKDCSSNQRTATTNESFKNTLRKAPCWKHRMRRPRGHAKYQYRISNLKERIT